MGCSLSREPRPGIAARIAALVHRAEAITGRTRSPTAPYAGRDEESDANTTVELR